MGDLVSVIMSTYNEKEEYVSQSIESIINQTYRNIEFIIILDNPENHQLRNLLMEYQSKDERIKVFQNKQNLGLVKSLNFALENCNGKYIARMDADDISELERLELQKEYLEEHDIDFVFTSVVYIDESGKEIAKGNNSELDYIQVKRKLEKTNMSNHPTWFLKKNIYTELGGYREIAYCEDYDFSLRSLNLGYKIGKLNRRLLRYRIRANSLSRSYSLEQFLNSRGILKLYKQKKINNDEKAAQLIISSKKNADHKAKINFTKANKLFNDAIENYKNGNLIKSFYKFIKCPIISKYYISKYFDLAKFLFE